MSYTAYTWVCHATSHEISGFMIGMRCIARCIENRSKCVKIAVNALYSGHALSHGPVALYSYTARADTAAVYSLQPIHYTALYAHPLDGAGGVVSRL